MKASVYIATSLDGFIARKDGSLDWLTGSVDSEAESESQEDFGFGEFMNSVDVLVMGRNTYQLVVRSGQWPYGDKRVIVLSNSLAKLDEKTPKTVELRAAPPQELYRELETSGARQLYVDGGKTIQGFLAAGLINELILTRIPVLLGTGIPLFGPLERDIQLRHIETHAFDNSFVQSKYEVLS